MATDPRPQSSTSFRGGGALGGGESLLNFEEGKKAAAKAEFFTVPPEATFLGGETYRDKIRGALRSLGADDRSINYVVGDMRADNFVDNVGLLDLTPAAIPLAVQEGSRAFKQGRYLEGSLDLGLSALEMIPGIKLATTPIKGFLSSLASKIKGSPNNLGALPTDPSRRTAIATMAAAPLAAGALSEIPIAKMVDNSAGKIIDDAAPVAKKIPLPKDFNPISDLHEVKEIIDDIIRLDIEDDIDEFDDIDDIIEQTGLGTRTDIAQSESEAGIPEIAIRSMRIDYGSSDEEIIEILEKFFGFDPEDAKDLVELTE